MKFAMTTDLEADAAVCMDAEAADAPILCWDGKYFSITFDSIIIPFVAMNMFGSLKVTFNLSGS